MALKDVPKAFNIDSEEDLRFAVAQYFHELGFELDELSFEDQFRIQIGHNTLEVNRKDRPRRDQVTGRSDLLLIRDGKSLAIVETKDPDHPLTDDDAWQAISYARLLLQMAPYAIVTNGKETRVYDTFAEALTPLETPSESPWCKHGYQVPSIGEDLKFQTTRILIGINPQTLRYFCQQQVAHAIEDLKGTVYEYKRYVPEIYIPRQEAVKAFNDWLSSDLPCFAVIGESGVGKTNFMCAVAETLSQDSFVLFYPGMRLVGGLSAAIQNDFVWEFHRDRELVYIVERFDAIANQHGHPIVVFVDGLDEFPGNHEAFKAELLDLAYRLRGRSVRLCLSCKGFDWGDFVIDKGQTYNRLAKSIYPRKESVHNPQAMMQPRAQEVGIWLSRFTDDELEIVFPRYKSVFSLQGELRDATRAECQMPLMLRFVAEVYSNREVDLPNRISSKELFDLYWDRRLNEVKQRQFAEQFLSGLAALSVQNGERQIELSAAIQQLGWSDSMNEAYRDAVRLGLLLVTKDEHGYEWLSFGFEKMRSYAFTVRAQRWPLQKPADVAKLIRAALVTLLGVEAVEFYLTTIDRGETPLLTELALLDFDCFLQLVYSLDLKSSIVQDVPNDKQQTALRNRLEQYATSYSEISRRYFPDLCERIEPYTTGEVGIWVHRSRYQLRTRTEAVPQPVALLSDQVAAALLKGNAPPQVYAELQPAGMTYIGMHDIAEQLPQRFAWDRIRSQIAKLFEHRFLDESSAPALLQERIWETLLYEPSFWVEASPAGQHFWQLLGFETIQSVATASIEDLRARARSLWNEYRTQITPGTEIGKLEGYQWWCFRQISPLYQLYYWLDLLRVHCKQLELSKFRVDDLFEYLHTHDLSRVVEILRSLLPDIMGAYKSIVLKNFTQIADRFAFFKSADSSMLVEVTRNPFGSYSDYITLGYILVPSVALPEKCLIYTCDGKDSLAHIPLIRKALVGSEESIGSSYGHASISRQIGGLRIEESNAILCFTRFPSHLPILDQVYQLLGNEVAYVLSGKLGEWHNVESGHTDDEELDWWISRYYRRQGLPPANGRVTITQSGQ